MLDMGEILGKMRDSESVHKCKDLYGQPFTSDAYSVFYRAVQQCMDKAVVRQDDNGAWIRCSDAGVARCHVRAKRINGQLRRESRELNSVDMDALLPMDFAAVATKRAANELLQTALNRSRKPVVALANGSYDPSSLLKLLRK